MAHDTLTDVALPQTITLTDLELNALERHRLVMEKQLQHAVSTEEAMKSVIHAALNGRALWSSVGAP